MLRSALYFGVHPHFVYFSADLRYYILYIFFTRSSRLREHGGYVVIDLRFEIL